MRSILVCCAGGLLLGAAVVGCVDHAQEPPVHARAAVNATPQPQPQTRSTGAVVAHHGDEKGVAEAQPATPAAQPSESRPATQDPLSEERARVSEGVTIATQQIDRLTRMQQYADPDRVIALQNAVDDLTARREKVLQEMRELEIRGASSAPGASDTLHSDLYRDLGNLESSVHESYGIAPPPGSGMPPPSPLPPTQMH